VKKSLDNIINEENLSISEDVNDIDFNSDDENSDDENSDDESESDDDIKKIIIKNKTYILDDNKLYKINKDGVKGKLYASFINEKIIKL
jgi:hypothetical protein